MSGELDNFLTHLNSIETNFGKRIIDLEARPLFTDYGKIIVDQRQQILALQNKIESYDMIFKNITARLDDHGAKLNSTKAGLDTLLAQVPVQVKPKYKIWPF